MKREKTYKINTEDSGLMITRNMLGVGEVTLDTNKDYNQTQLENLHKIFPQVILSITNIVEEEEIEEYSQKTILYVSNNHVGGGYYIMPDGKRIRGKENALIHYNSKFGKLSD